MRRERSGVMSDKPNDVNPECEAHEPWSMECCICKPRPIDPREFCDCWYTAGAPNFFDWWNMYQGDLVLCDNCRNVRGGKQFSGISRMTLCRVRDPGRPGLPTPTCSCDKYKETHGTGPDPDCYHHGLTFHEAYLRNCEEARKRKNS